jgi:hypothetical protein
MTELVREITDWLWCFTDIRKVVNNNYIVLQSIVRNVVKDLGINDGNFDLQAFMDNFDVHELDLQSQDTFVDSLTELLVRFKVGGDVDAMMDKAPIEIENRLREIIDYLRHNPHDTETMGYAKLLIDQLSEFDGALARKYEYELDTLTKPVTKVVEPVHVVKPVVFKQPRYSKLRKVLVGLLTVTIGLVSIPFLVVYTIMSTMRWLS